MLRDTRLYRLLFFFLTIPRPPTSTLFPYTTLFRSFRVPGEAKTVTFVNNDAATDVYISDKRQELLAKFPPEDRKSTRLNSSHSQISYAVFCLKKKKFRVVVAAAAHVDDQRADVAIA